MVNTWIQSLTRVKQTKHLTLRHQPGHIVLASCPSLEVLVLDISCFKESGPLKIDNKRLKLLQVLETKKIDGIQVSSTRLDSLAIGRLSCGKDDFVLREEGESPRNKFLEENNKDHPFPNAKFRVETVWMHNFSGSEEEFALASCLIRQGTVIKRMMIKSTSFPARKKLEIETAVAKLQALIRKKEQWQFAIKCF
ncbi:hypothetical protein F2Q69_00044049 [Brassica cretica]|uniref:FBD domain-containing protein n=1 Tax=Brassica cretica TaxID=69181 RepID=A0A8S9NGZ5_BRACR|nr:hypothetical protein F2Q69_00044049 [Brassica cretica]